MRIGIDARLWGESGVGRYTRNLIEELAKIDKKNEYVLFFRSKELAHVLLPGENFEKKLADIRWHTIEEQIKLPSIFYKEKLDLVHFPYFSVPIFYHKPFVVTIHDLILHHFPTGQASTLPFPFYWIKLFGYKFVMQQTAKKAQKIITVSYATKQEIVDHLGVDQNKVVVTYEGIDEKVQSSKIKDQNKSQNIKYKIENTKYFLYVGNAYPHKNLERLIEAFSLFCHPERSEGSKDSDLRENNTRLILVGKEDYFRKRLKEKVLKIGLEDLVIFYGEATDEQLVSLYKNALALVMPSFMEGFGLPILEAMANKCLVLTSNIPVHREIAQNAGIYFDPRSVNDLTNKLEEINSNNINRYRGNIKNGFEQSQKFSWEKMAKETLSVYESSISL